MKNSQLASLHHCEGDVLNQSSLFSHVMFIDVPEQTFKFQINGCCPLLDEHFPGFPVVPASLIIGFVQTLVTKFDESKSNQLILKNIRFNLPLTAGREYVCQFKEQPSNTLLFTIKCEGHDVYSRGLLKSVNLNKNNNIALNKEINYVN